MAHQYTVFVRDPNRVRVCEVDDFSALDCTVRYMAVGAWALTVPATARAVDYFQLGSGGIIVERDGTVIFSGPVDRMERRLSDTENVLALWGGDDNVYLTERYASPQPGGPAGDYSVNAYDTFTGVTEAALLHYVDKNLGPGALGSGLTARGLLGLTLAANAGRGISRTWGARFGMLLTFLQYIALDGGLSFRIVQVGTGLQFQVYAPTDKSATVTFDQERGTLRGYTYSQAMPTVNFETVAGGQQLTARIFQEGGDYNSIAAFGRRIEGFRDRRDTTDTGQLQAQLNADITQGADQRALSLQPVDTDAQQYLRDYSLGDIVTVVIDEVPVTDVLQEVRIQLSQDQAEVITPAIGTQGLRPQDALAVWAELREHAGRLRNLESV